MKLEQIGFYSLSEKRAKDSCVFSIMQRCELILTDRCNFNCPYCRGIKKEHRGELPLNYAKEVINYWVKDNLQNIRFSGGEPTLYPFLFDVVDYSKKKGIKRIALSTNGSADLRFYKRLAFYGINDFSISLDACCSSAGEKMTGGAKDWEKIIYNIKELAKISYTTIGVVLNEENINNLQEIIKFIDTLDISDIRIIPSAQYNIIQEKDINMLQEISKKYPILNYRVNNILKGKSVRGINKNDSKKCPLVLDDSAILNNYHFPCIIYMREQGKPIGKVNSNMREEREQWFLNHNSHQDKICKNNCLDVCIDYNNKWEYYHSIKRG